MSKSGILFAAIAACGLAAAAAIVASGGLWLAGDQLSGVEYPGDSENAMTYDPGQARPEDFPMPGEPAPAVDPGSPKPGVRQAPTIPASGRFTGKWPPDDARALPLVTRMLAAQGAEFALLLRDCLRNLPEGYLAARILEMNPALFCGMLLSCMDLIRAVLPGELLLDLSELSRQVFASYPDAALAQAALTFDPSNQEQIDLFLAWDATRIAAMLDQLGPKHFTSPVVLFQIVAGLEASGMPQQCARFAGELLRLQPDNSFAYHLMISLAPAEAAAILAESVNADPGNHFFRYRLGSSLLSCGDRAKAFDMFREALKIEPGDPDYMQGLIEANPAMAAGVLRAEVENDPSDQEAVGKLARAYLDLGRSTDAFALACRAFEMEPDDPEWTDLMMRIDPSAALVKVTEIARTGPSDPVLLGLLGRARMKTGDRAGAFEAFREAFGRCHTQLDSVETRSAWADEMIEADPARATAILETALGFDASCLAEVKAWRASDAAGLPAAAAHSPSYSDDFDRGASGGSDQRSFSDADFEYDGAESEINRMDVAMLGKLGRSLIASGRAADGSAVIEFAIARLKGSMFQGVAEAAKLAGALGRYSPARAFSILDEILASARRSKTPELIGAVADGYREMDRRGEALAVYREALRADPTNEEWITAIRDLEGRW